MTLPRLFLVTLGVLLAFGRPAHAQAWVPPLGIPTPGFGVAETAPAEPDPWVAGVSGFYYVCPTCSGSTDSSNPNGHPGRPRQTIPQPLAAGSVVRLKGTYDRQHAGGGWTPGTASAPIWIRGAVGDVPTVRRIWEFRGTSAYTIVENIHFAAEGTSTNGGAIWVYEGSHHIVVRQNELSGNLTRAGGLYVYGGANNVVLWGNRVHDLGNVNDTGDQDAHAITTGDARNVWIVDNDVTRFSGSGIYMHAGFNNNGAAGPIFVGRNTVYAGKQTGIGIKNTSDLIISQNTVHTFSTSSSSTGACSASQYGGSRIWWLFNTLYNCVTGIEVASTSGLGDGTDHYMVGNVIHTVQRGINLYPDAVRNRHLVANTIANAAQGIVYEGGVGTLDLVNNLIAATQHVLAPDARATTSASASSFHHNLLVGAVNVRWGGGGLPSGNLSTADPRFFNAAARDYRLVAGSPAIDAGVADGDNVYSLFQSLYGRSIAGDRPIGGGWDIGAFEYTPGTLPGQPTNLRVVP